MKPGDRVAHIARNSDLAVLLFLGTARAAAVFVLLTPVVTDAELSSLLSHSQAVLVAVPETAAARVNGLEACASVPLLLLEQARDVQRG